MDLKLRKRIQNGALPGMDDLLVQAGLFNHPSTTSGIISPADAFKQDVIDANNKATAALPSFKQPTAVGGNWKDKFGGVAGVVSNGVGFVDTMRDISTNKYTSDEMMGSGGTTNQAANGVDYQELSVDSNGIQSLIDATAKAGIMSGVRSGAALGGSIGYVIPGVGTAIGTVGGAILGGIFGGLGSAKAKREAERLKMIAINRTNALNTQNREMAYTTGLRNRFARENVTDDTQSLFHAAEGIEGDVDPATRTTRHKHLVDTAKYGIIKHKANSMGNKGETMVAGESDENGMHNVHGIDRGPNDTAPMYLTLKDDVFSDKFIDWETGLPISLAVRLNAAQNGGKISTQDKLRYEMNQNIERMLTYTGKRKINMLPHYLGGTTNSFVNRMWNGTKELVSGIDLGNLATLGNAYAIAAQRDARAQGLRSPQSYVANTYEKDALNQLNSLHSNYYPVLAANREIEGRGRASIAQSGGLSAGQRMLGYMGLTNQTQLNNAQAIFEHQNHENALRAQAARASLEAGNQSAVRQQQAYQWDEDMLAKAHAARENMLETSAYDRQNSLAQFFANQFKKMQFDRTMNLYESQQKTDDAAVLALINRMNANSTPTTVSGVDGNAAMLQIDPTTGGFARINPFSASQLLTPTALTAIQNAGAIANNPYLKPTSTTQVSVKKSSSKRTAITPKRSAATKQPTGTRTIEVTDKNDPVVQLFSRAAVVRPAKKPTAIATSSSKQKPSTPERFTPYAFGNDAITERFPNASKLALASDKKRNAVQSREKDLQYSTEKERKQQLESMGNLLNTLEKLVIGKQAYEKQHGKGSYGLFNKPAVKKQKSSVNKQAARDFENRLGLYPMFTFN